MDSDTCRAVDGIVARDQAVGRAPSLVAAVVRDGALAHFAGAGEQPAPDPDIQYRIGSISKTLTAVLLLRLRDEGALALDDPVRRYLPEVPPGWGTGVGAVTLRHLLCHASGLQREPLGPWWERSAGPDLDTFLAGLRPDQRAYPPYRGYHYSNLAYGLLGAVLHRVTAEDWASLVSTRILAPLGMRRTTYHPVAPFAAGYVVHPWHGTLREEPRHDAGAMAPAGQLWSTAADLARWAAFLADPAGVPGGAAVLSPQTLAEMCAPAAIADPDGWTGGHGLGIELYRAGERVYAGHGGSMPGYQSVLMVHRPSRTGVVAFTNTYTLRDVSIGALGQDILGAVLDGGRPAAPARTQPDEAPRPWRPGSEPPPEVAPLCGRWWWMGREFEAAWDGAAGELVLTYLGQPARAPWRFSPEDTDRWRGRSGLNDGEVLAVRRDDADAVVALDIATFVFTRHPDLIDPPR